MKVTIHVERKHAVVIALGAFFIVGAMLVTAFGGSSPVVLGHSAGELIVDSTSIVDNSITAADIDESTLAGAPCASITGSASLCDGSDQDTDTRCDNTNCGNLNSPAIGDPSDSTVDILDSLTINGDLFFATGTNVITANGQFVSMDVDYYMPDNRRMVCTGGGCDIDIQSPVEISGGNTLSVGGSNVVRRTTGCPSFNYLTTDGAAAVGCGGVVDTGLRVA